MPNTKGKMNVGYDSGDAMYDVIGEVGGSKDAIIVAHDHAAVLIALKEVLQEGANPVTFPTGGWLDAQHVMAWPDYVQSNTRNLTVDIPAMGSSGTNANVPPYVVFMKIIKAL
jgi:hypothetical protein